MADESDLEIAQDLEDRLIRTMKCLIDIGKFAQALESNANIARIAIKMLHLTLEDVYKDEIEPEVENMLMTAYKTCKMNPYAMLQVVETVRKEGDLQKRIAVISALLAGKAILYDFPPRREDGNG